jgi:hypothetical protein
MMEGNRHQIYSKLLVLKPRLGDSHECSTPMSVLCARRFFMVLFIFLSYIFHTHAKILVRNTWRIVKIAKSFLIDMSYLLILFGISCSDLLPSIQCWVTPCKSNTLHTTLNGGGGGGGRWGWSIFIVVGVKFRTVSVKCANNFTHFVTYILCTIDFVKCWPTLICMIRSW